MSIVQKILLSLSILVLSFMCLTILFGEDGLADLNHRKQKYEALMSQVEELDRENLALHRKIYRIKNDPKYIEELARTELGMVKEDELILKVR